MNASTTKQKHVIVLHGVPDSGKTTTLNLLIQLLLGTEGSSLLKEDRKNLRGEDRRVLISYQGKKVYVATPGDIEREIWRSIMLSGIEGCDIFVSAARSRGRTGKVIDEYAGALQVAPVRVRKRKVDQGRDEANRAQAQELKNRIDAFIKAHP
nr:hypothetical protein [uncultured Porphyromonas sp.]